MVGLACGGWLFTAASPKDSANLEFLGILEFLKSLQRENMQEIKKNFGLILKGGNITLSDFTFERPFALLGNNLLVKVIGGGV